MKVTIIGATRLTGTSRKTGRSYDSTVAHIAYARIGVNGMAVETIWLDPTEHPVESIAVGSTYALDRDHRGYVVGFEPVCSDK